MPACMTTFTNNFLTFTNKGIVMFAQVHVDGIILFLRSKVATLTLIQYKLLNLDTLAEHYLTGSPSNSVKEGLYVLKNPL